MDETTENITDSDSETEINADGDVINEYKLLLSANQIEAVKQLFEKNDWDLKISDSSLDITAVNNDICTDKSKRKDMKRLGEIFNQETNEDEDKCVFCLCSPCVTDERNRQSWWPAEISEPSLQNSRQRKNCYQRFWGMLANFGVWQCEQYLEKKRTSLSNIRTNPDYIILKREIMPECVLKFVRNLFPNPKGYPYMGHKWR